MISSPFNSLRWRASHQASGHPAVFWRSSGGALWSVFEGRGQEGFRHSACLLTREGVFWCVCIYIYGWITPPFPLASLLIWRFSTFQVSKSCWRSDTLHEFQQQALLCFRPQVYRSTDLAGVPLEAGNSRVGPQAGNFWSIPQLTGTNKIQKTHFGVGILLEIPSRGLRSRSMVSSASMLQLRRSSSPSAAPSGS